jgi:hypothetical protein
MQNFSISQKFCYGDDMNTLRLMCAATVISLLLAVSALAGQIGSGGVVAPPPPPPSETSVTSSVTATVILIILSLRR